ncbi:MAG: hypothetical protein JXA42_17940 [Anaerolineales bacterium]|nr:hypothetical protein [Anaerolineales bacterium]
MLNPFKPSNNELMLFYTVILFPGSDFGYKDCLDQAIATVYAEQWLAIVQSSGEIALKYYKLITNLKKRALNFHQVLLEYGVYTRNVTENEFLQRIHGATEKTAMNLVGGIGDPGATILGFPGSLLFNLSDVLHTTTWDIEDDSKVLFENLSDLFQETDFRFVWRVDDKQQKIIYQIDSTEGSVACPDLWIDPLDFSEFEPRLNGYLQSREWMLYFVTTGDQTFRFVLMPLKAVDAVRDYLIISYPEIHPCYDPRSEWLYNGVPV